MYYIGLDSWTGNRKQNYFNNSACNIVTSRPLSHWDFKGGALG
jgi:hypothetical protein